MEQTLTSFSQLTYGADSYQLLSAYLWSRFLPALASLLMEQILTSFSQLTYGADSYYFCQLTYGADSYQL